MRLPQLQGRGVNINNSQGNHTVVRNLPRNLNRQEDVKAGVRAAVVFRPTLPIRHSKPNTIHLMYLILPM